MPSLTSMPYRHLPDVIDIDFKAIRFDGKPLDLKEHEVIDSGSHQILLKEYLEERDEVWNVLELDCEYKLTGQLATVLPPGGSVESDTCGFVAIDDVGAQARDGVVLPGHESGSVTFRFTREGSFGPIRLTPQFYRTASIEPVVGFSSRKREQLAVGTSWTIRFGDPPEMPGRGIESEFIKFSEPPPSVSFLKDRKDSISYLQITDEGPKLWLNEEVEGFRQVWDWRGPSGYKRRVQDLMRVACAQPVILQLAVYALNKCNDSTRIDSEELSGWPCDVLKQLAKALDQDEETQANAWIESWVSDDGDGRSQALIDISSAVQLHVNSSAIFEAAYGQVARGRSDG